MAGIRKRGEEIRQFIIDNVAHHPKDIGSLTTAAFGISRQAVNKHMQRLVRGKDLLVRGTTRDRHYLLRPGEERDHIYNLDGNLEEDVVWRSDIHPIFSGFPGNVLDIWRYGFTEILNNAIDHSSGSSVYVRVAKNATDSEIVIYDDGEGIFKKIQRELKLLDERQAVLELAKGKLTTDPERHSGEGIFFSSRMFDHFEVISGSTYFSHQFNETEDWIVEQKKLLSGTTVYMKIANNSSRTMKGIFDSFTSGDGYGFTKTVVPVRLAQYGNDKLVSRSQAKRLLARVEKFKEIIFDFEEVEIIGQAFADEVFRVFKGQHPDIQLFHVRANKDVQQMIQRAQGREA